MNLNSLSKVLVLGGLALSTFSLLPAQEVNAGSGPFSSVLNTLIDRGTVYTRTYDGATSSYLNDYTQVTMPEGVYAITDVKNQYIATAPHGKKIFAQAFIGVNKDSKGRYLYNLYSKLSGESAWYNINLHMTKSAYATDFEMIIQEGKVFVYYKDPIWGNLVYRYSKNGKTWSQAIPVSFEGMKSGTNFSMVKREYYVPKTGGYATQNFVSFTNIKGNLVTMVSNGVGAWSIVDIGKQALNSELAVAGAFGIAQFRIDVDQSAYVRSFKCSDYATCKWTKWEKLSNIQIAGELKVTSGFFGQFGSILVAARDKDGYIQTMDIQLSSPETDKVFIYGDFINTNFVSDYDPAIFFDNISSNLYLSALGKDNIVYEKFGANSKFEPVISKVTGAPVVMQTFSASYQAL